MSTPPPPPKRTTDTSVSPRTFFSPKKKINRMIGKTTITTYPDITPEMPNEERSHAFSINRAALVNARAIPYATKTSFLGEFMGESTIVDVEKAEYLRFAHDWCHCGLQPFYLSSPISPIQNGSPPQSKMDFSPCPSRFFPFLFS